MTAIKRSVPARVIIANVATITGVTQANVEKVLRMTAHHTTQLLVDNDIVWLPHLGKVYTQDIPAREGRNPATGGRMTIPAKRRVKFFPAKAIRDALL